jgi:deazaflavin-dependent oxidoreductase (nitroreductase family)
VTGRHQSAGSPLRAKPTGLLRRLLKFPIVLYRRNLGWIFGHRFLLLTHCGRKTGLLRQTMLEVVQYDPATRESIVLSGWGGVADWYRNIRAQPAIAVQIAREAYEPQQRFLTPEEAAAVAANFERRHPIEALLVPQVLGWLGWSAEGRHPTWRTLATAIPLVAFRPQE